MWQWITRYINPFIAMCNYSRISWYIPFVGSHFFTSSEHFWKVKDFKVTFFEIVIFCWKMLCCKQRKIVKYVSERLDNLEKFIDSFSNWRFKIISLHYCLVMNTNYFNKNFCLKDLSEIKFTEIYPSPTHGNPY